MASHLLHHALREKSVNPRSPQMNEENLSSAEFFSNSISCDVLQLEKFIQKGLDVNEPLSLEDGRKPLHAAATNGNADMVQALLARGAYIDVFDHYGNTPTHLASEEGHLEVVMLLIDKEANLYLKNDRGWSVLQSAVRNEQVAVTQLLLNKKEINVNEPFKKCVIESTTFSYSFNYRHEENTIFVKSALYYASKLGNLPLVSKLLVAGAIVNEQFNMPLMIAVKNGHTEVLYALLENGADVDGKDFNGQRPLDVAIRSGQFDIVKILLASGAAINEVNYESSLYLAYTSGKMEIVNLLLENGAVISASEMWKVFHFALDKGFNNIAEDIINKGREFSGLHPESRYLYQAIEKANIPIVKLIVDRGVDINIRDCFGNTPLIKATQLKLVPIIELLLQKGADIKLCDSWGYSAAYYSVTNCDSLHIWEIFLNFVESVDDIVLTKSDDTALVKEITTLNSTLVKFLIIKGANVNEKDHFGNTPLHSLVRGYMIRKYGFPDRDVSKWRRSAEVLLDAGASIFSVNKYEETPLNLVIENCSTNFVKTFLEKGLLSTDKDTMENQHLPILGNLLKHRHFGLIKLLLNKVDCNGKVMLSCDNTSRESDGNKLIENVCEDSDGLTSLHLAAHNGSIDMLNIALQHEGNIDVVTGEGFTPLQISIYQGNFKVAKYLCDKGASVNIRDKFGLLPVHLAIIHGDIPFLEHIYDKTNLKDCGLSGIPLLHFTAYQGNIAMMSFLLSKGADINERDESENSLLHFAVRIENSELINFLIQKGINKNFRNGSGDTALLTALKELKYSQFEIVSILVKHRVDVNIVDSEMKTALHIAVKLKSQELITLLLEKGGTNVNALDRSGNSPFSDLFHHVECTNSFPFDPTKVVILFLKHGAHLTGKPYEGLIFMKMMIDNEKIIQECNINFRSIITSSQQLHELLKRALLKKKYNLIEVLLSQGFSFYPEHPYRSKFYEEVFGKKGNDQLMQLILDKDKKLDLRFILIEAVKDTNKDLVKALLNKLGRHFDTYYRGKPFKEMFSSRELKKYGMVQIFLDKGVSVTRRSNTFYVPFEETVKAGNCAMVNILLDKGVRINNHKWKDGPVLNHAIKANNKHMVKTLLARGARPNTEDQYGATPLCLACLKGNVEIILMLLENGAIIEDINRLTLERPIHVATSYGKYDAVKLLLDKGANISAVDIAGNTALHKTVSSEVTKLLIDKGASVNAKNPNQETPLHCANKPKPHFVGFSVSHAVSEVLIKNGAVINARDILGKTPLHYAANHGDTRSIMVLINNGAKIDMMDYNGRTALNDVVCGGRSENVKCLLANGASTDVIDLRSLVSSGGTMNYQCCFSQRNLRVLEKFFFLQKLAGLPCNQDVKFTCSPVEKDEYIKELNRIKETVIDDRFSLYDVFSRCQKPNYLYNVELVEKLEALFKSGYLRQFPHYDVVIRHTFYRSLRKFHLTRQAVETMYCDVRQSLYREIPVPVWERVFNLLSLKDLENIIESADQKYAFPAFSASRASSCDLLSL